MTRGRTWAALAVVPVVVAVAGVVGWTVWGGSAGGQDLVKYSNEDGEANRYVNLDDGRAQLSVGSPDGHRIVVQWRDADGDWGEPQTVWADEKNLAIDSTVRYGGGTVAIQELYTTDVHSEDDTDAFTIAIVCRDGACDTKKGTGADEAQVAPDGRTVYLGQDEKGVDLWTTEEGIHHVPWSGHPGLGYHVDSPSRPVLAPDGSLRVVTSHPSRGSCTFELLTGTPGAADLTSAASAAEPLRGRGGSDCRSYLDTYSSDWVRVHPEDHRAGDFAFVHDGDTWTTTYDDPSGLEIVDVDRGCCDSSIIGFVHWNDVTWGSPDGQRVQVQTHLLGDETWSRPQVLDGAPAGHRCTWMDGYEVGDEGFAVLMTCDRGASYAVAATPDLAHWESTFVTGVTQDPHVDGDRLTVGDTTWTPEDGFAD
jgi:hypothetical protein